jgi:hypothetical protein
MGLCLDDWGTPILGLQMKLITDVQLIFTWSPPKDETHPMHIQGYLSVPRLSALLKPVLGIPINQPP